MPYPQLSTNLPRDASNKAFNGPNGKVWRGITSPANSDEAIPYIILMGPDGNTVICTVAGLFVQGPDSNGTPATARPLLLGGKAEATIPGVQSDGDAVYAWFDNYGALSVRVKDSAQADIDFTKRQTVAGPVNDIGLNSAATSQTLLSANSSRKGLILTNTDANDCYVRYSASACSTTQFTVKIPSGWTWEMPEPIYTGGMTAIWAADGSGTLIGSEL